MFKKKCFVNFNNLVYFKVAAYYLLHIRKKFKTKVAGTTIFILIPTGEEISKKI